MPMRFARMNGIHLFEHRKHRALPPIGYRFFDHLDQRFLVQCCTWRQPQGDTRKAIVIVRGSKIKSSAAECSGKARERLEVLLRIRPSPSSRRISTES